MVHKNQNAAFQKKYLSSILICTVFPRIVSSFEWFPRQLFNLWSKNLHNLHFRENTITSVETKHTSRRKQKIYRGLNSLREIQETFFHISGFSSHVRKDKSNLIILQMKLTPRKKNRRQRTLWSASQAGDFNAKWFTFHARQNCSCAT